MDRPAVWQMGRPRIVPPHGVRAVRNAGGCRSIFPPPVTRRGRRAAECPHSFAPRGHPPGSQSRAGPDRTTQASRSPSRSRARTLAQGSRPSAPSPVPRLGDPPTPGVARMYECSGSVQPDLALPSGKYRNERDRSRNVHANGRSAGRQCTHSDEGPFRIGKG